MFGRARWFAGAFGAVGFLLASFPAEAAATAQVPPASATKDVPIFIANNTGWRHFGGKDFVPAPAGYPDMGGLGAHPDHPHFGNTSGQPPTPRIGNDGASILLAWAKEQMKKTREAIEAGGVPYDPADRCWPAGVPAVITFAVEPVYFHQARANEIVMIYQRGQVVRHIYMNQPHTQNLKPSWYGESVGWYEGDTLVIDTIGLTNRSFVDVFNTPHTEQLHVVERYRLIDNGTVLQAIMIVEDPGTFTRPWAAMKLHRQVSAPVEESLCQVNNDDRFNQGLRPVPTATKPDF
jgi:hypothetical protein